MTAYSVLEYRSLPRGDGPGCIPDAAADGLVRLARASGFAGAGEGGVLEDRRHELRARGVVGVLATGKCTLEILPKIDVVAEEGSAEERGAIRRRLVHMLAVALDIRIETGRLTELDWQRDTLLEILIRIFCDRLIETVRRGMPRRYLEETGDLPALRGGLDVHRQFTRNAVAPQRLACRFDELSVDIALNRIIKAAVTLLAGAARNPATQQKLRMLAFHYAEVSTVPASALR